MSRIHPVGRLGCFTALIAMTACTGGVGQAIRPDDPTYAAAASAGGRCLTPSSREAPLVVDWDLQSRGDLEVGAVGEVDPLARSGGRRHQRSERAPVGQRERTRPRLGRGFWFVHTERQGCGDGGQQGEARARRT